VNFWDHGKLCYLTQRLGFERFAQHYSANWTDAGGMAVAVKSRDRELTVHEVAGIGPIELWAIENAVEAIRSRVKWIRK
jgi:hypothetical protein